MQCACCALRLHGLTEAIMAVDIGAALIDVFMVLVIAAGLVLLAAMVREQIPRRRLSRAEVRAARNGDGRRLRPGWTDAVRLR
jgi:hypothetical protein